MSKNKRWDMPKSKPETLNIERTKIWKSPYRDKAIGCFKGGLSGRTIQKRLKEECGFSIHYDSILLFCKALQANTSDYATLKIAEFDKIIDAVSKHAKAILMLEKQLEDSFKQSQGTGERSKTLARDLLLFSKLILGHVELKKQLGLVGNQHEVSVS